jgi:hypothetical protein
MCNLARVYEAENYKGSDPWTSRFKYGDNIKIYLAESSCEDMN